MKTIKIFLLINLSIFLSCSALTYKGLPFGWNDKDDPIFRRYTDVEGVEHLWKIDMDTLVFPRDNHLLDQIRYYHGGESGWGGESIKLIITNQDSTGNGDKQYIIRRVYPHVIEWKDTYAY